jgi:glycosyltransferase involved in cell wall biosynthesis
VLDSQSTDNTTDLAKNAGAKTTVRAFDGYASQRNFGLNLNFTNHWILILDADERVPKALANEMKLFVDMAPANICAARMRRRDIWWGTWLKHAQISPFYIRLVRRGRAHYEREINEVLVVDGEIRELATHFDHYPFSKGLDHWFAKHNVYSQMEAHLISSRKSIHPNWKLALFGPDFNERRIHQKAIFYRLPGRPLIKFLYMLLIRRAFLDGAAGFRYSILQAIYEYMIVLKVEELEQSKKYQYQGGKA